MQQKFIICQNKKQKTMSQLKKKNKIYLLTKNLKAKKANKKLNYVKVGLFFIKRQKKYINYKLNLFSDIKIYPNFLCLIVEVSRPKNIYTNHILFLI